MEISNLVLSGERVCSEKKSVLLMIYPFVLPLYRRTDSKLGHFILLKRLEDASESERAWSGIC
ncbi:MAG: hypothetical protein IJ271_09045, partial [Bacteroidales bacterium]|nr:hypothetical protein [Bacteroidales bacterium]